MGKREKWFPTSNFDFNFDFRISSFEIASLMDCKTIPPFPIYPTWLKPILNGVQEREKRGERGESGHGVIE